MHFAIVTQLSLVISRSVQSLSMHPESVSSTVTVYPDGYTTLDFPVKEKLACSMPACLFPVDQHTCRVTIGALGYDIHQLRLVPDERIAEIYRKFSTQSTGLWDVKLHNLTEQSDNVIAMSKEKAGKRTSSMLITFISLKHKPLYFWITVLFPITMICLVTFCSVLLPRDSGERTSLLITCFLAQIVYLDTVLKSVPKTSDYVPLLVGFLFTVLVFTACQIALTALTSYYADRANHGKRISTWHKRIVGFISKMCMIGRIKKKKMKMKMQMKMKGNRVVSSEPGELYETELKTWKDSTTSTPIVPFIDHSPDDASDIDADSKDASSDNTDPAHKKKCQWSNNASKAVDRISVLTSLILLIATPIFFTLIYNGTIKYNCSTKLKV